MEETGWSCDNCGRFNVGTLQCESCGAEMSSGVSGGLVPSKGVRTMGDRADAKLIKWEYLTEFHWANAREYQDFLKERFPETTINKHSPESLIPGLDHRGAEGWELVNMEPVADVGKNMDVYFTGGTGVWSNAYFCVFKRPYE